MANLSTKTKKINLIVSFKGYNPSQLSEKLDALCGWLNENSEIYGAILHDKDFTEDGEKKTPHIHAVFELKAVRGVRLGTTLNKICECLRVLPDAVTIEKYTSFEGSFQYLIHKNNPEKYQYDKSAIRSNMDAEDVTNYLDAVTNAFDFDAWNRICKESRALPDVIKKVGLSYYNMYRSTICDLFRSYHGGELYGDFLTFDNIRERYDKLYEDVKALAIRPDVLLHASVSLKDFQQVIEAFAALGVVKG